MKKSLSALARLSGLIFLVLVWQIFSSLNLFERTLFPSPLETLSAFINLFIRNNLAKEIAFTVQRVFSGFIAATLLGVFIGLLVGINKVLFRSFEGLIDFFRSIPVVTLYPIFIMIFGINDEAKIAMTFWATFWIITLNTIYGVRQSNETRRAVAKVYGASKTQSFKWITFYEALPLIMVGMRVAVSYALLTEIICEMFMGSNFGIGQKIYEANVRLSTPELYALVAITGVLGVLINRLFVMFERKIIPWTGEL